MEIDEDRLRELAYEDELLTAKNYVYRLLGRRMYTAKEIRGKLEDRQYMEQVITAVITTLQDYGYVNDRVYAKEWIRSRMRSKPKGKMALRQELLRKGIDKSIIEAALEEAFDESEEGDLALALAMKRIRSYKNDAPDVARKKLHDFLLRRGFSFETVRETIEELIPYR